jgi:hypothetical protein
VAKEGKVGKRVGTRWEGEGGDVGGVEGWGEGERGEGLDA